MSNKNQYQITRRVALKAIIASSSVTASFTTLALSNEDNKQEENEMNIIVIVNFETKEEKTADFKKILESVKIELPKVNGCMGVDIFENSSIATQFTLVETWENKELHQANLENLANDGTWDTIASHLSKGPKSDYFIQL